MTLSVLSLADARCEFIRFEALSCSDAQARQRAELLRPILAELAGMPARAIARELTARGVRLPGWARGTR